MKNWIDERRGRRFLLCLTVCIALCSGLFACNDKHLNTVVVFLRGGDLRWDTLDQGREIGKALNDMLTLGPDGLRTRRYANYEKGPSSWTIIQLLQRSFVSGKERKLDETWFYQDFAEPEARTMTREHLQALRKAMGLRQGSELPDTDVGNTIAAFLVGAEQQWETADQGREIERALNDMLTLGPDVLRTQRYANYQMEPNAWSITELLYRYFVSEALRMLDEGRFYQDITAPSAQAAIRGHLREVRRSIALH